MASRSVYSAFWRETQFIFPSYYARPLLPWFSAADLISFPLRARSAPLFLVYLQSAHFIWFVQLSAVAGRRVSERDTYFAFVHSCVKYKRVTAIEFHAPNHHSEREKRKVIWMERVKTLRRMVHYGKWILKTWNFIKHTISPAKCDLEYRIHTKFGLAIIKYRL